MTGNFANNPVNLVPDGIATKSALATLNVFQPADLVINSITSPPEAGFGGNLTLNYSVMNQGLGDASASFANKVYLSTDAIITTNDLYLGQFSQFASLAAGASQIASHVVTIPANQAVGSYYIGVVADADACVVESDESNNSKGTALNIVASDIDATVTAVTASASRIGKGDTITLVADLSNLGTNTIPSDALLVNYYLSTDPVITVEDTLLGSTTTGILTGGASTSVSISPTITIALGTYYIGVIIDPDDQITETNENNNVITGATLVIDPAVDLVMTDVTAPAAGRIGGTMTVSTTVTEQGITGQNSTSAFIYPRTQPSRPMMCALVLGEYRVDWMAVFRIPRPARSGFRVTQQPARITSVRLRITPMSSPKRMKATMV